jgi:hypothetical protein
MNERIRLLAEQARQYAFAKVELTQDPTEWSTKYYNEMFEQKFAELIVRECINSLGSQTDQSNLRKKFGIAEPTVEGIGRYYPPPDINSAESQYDRRARIENSSKQEDFKKNIKEAFKNGADLSNQDTP